MLRDMLHLGKVGAHLDEDGFGSMAAKQVGPGPMDRTPATPPTLVGTAHAARITGGTWRKNNKRPGTRRRKEQGRPHNPDSRRALAKAIDRDIANGVLNWQEPVEYSSAMKMTMVDRQTQPHDPKRLVLTTLRAKKTFQGRPTNDFVKVEVEDDNGQGRLYFAKCEAFFRDSRGEHYVALRWLDQSGPTTLNTTVRLPRLKLRPTMMPKSYSVLPASSIHNGALLIAADEFYWAVMSPREQKEYVRVQTTS